MDKTLLSLSRFFALIPLWILRARWPVLIILISSTVFMGYGAATRTTMHHMQIARRTTAGTLVAVRGGGEGDADWAGWTWVHV